MTPHGHFHWNELMTRDTAAARAFYTETLGWDFNEWPMPDGKSYWVAMSGDTPVGGVFEMTGPEMEGVPEHWGAYISVDDVDARVAKAKAQGAAVIREPFDVPDVGRIAILRAPGGAVIGWMTPAEPQAQ